MHFKLSDPLWPELDGLAGRIRSTGRQFDHPAQTVVRPINTTILIWFVNAQNCNLYTR